MSFTDLLETFWAAHDPTRRSRSRRYRALLFVHDEAQAEAARASLARLAERLDEEVRTEIREDVHFHAGERKHQKHALRRTSWLEKELEAYYGRPEDLRDSTAAARVNGYVAGFGTLAEFDAVASELGLSERALRLLRKRVASGERKRRAASHN